MFVEFLHQIQFINFPSEDYYDYIILGGGTAGFRWPPPCHSPIEFLCLNEAYGNPNLMTQEGLLTTLTEVDTFDSPAQAFTSEDGVPNARGTHSWWQQCHKCPGFYSKADLE